ncbi:MAG: hypothetical protein LBN33_09730 [Desulfovibrio sp.]|jgi:TPR repeat protein|nr:hypothetical protein [Desulfovibrio sp.]
MKALYVSDPVKGPGFGLLRISDATGVLAAGSLRCRIMRVADGMILSREGWSHTITNLPLRGGARKGDGFFFSVGPEVTDKLDATGEYNLTLACSDGSELVAPLEFEQVEYSQEQAAENDLVPTGRSEVPEMVARADARLSYPASVSPVPSMDSPAASRPMPVRPVPPMDFPSASKPMTVRAAPETVGFAGAIDPAYAVADSAKQEMESDLALLAASRDKESFGEQAYRAQGGYLASEDVPGGDDLPAGDLKAEAYFPSEQKSAWTGKVLPALFFLLLLLGGGFAVWTIFSLTSEGDVGGQVPLRADVSPPPAPKTEAATRTESAPEVGTPLQRARAHLSGRADAPTSLAMSIEFRIMNQGADAAFLLAEDAAQKGLPEAMLITGSFYDPADVNPSGTIIKDPFEALNWYSKAAGAGVVGASGRIAALKNLLRMRSSAGNREAERLLKKF